VSVPEEMSRDELVALVRRQAGQITAQAEQLAAQDRQITSMAGQVAELVEANEALAGKLATLEHLLSRNSGNSSNPPSKDDDPGKPAPPDKKGRRGKDGPTRPRGKQRGAPGSHLPWTESPDQRQDRFRRAAVTAVMTWAPPVTWGSWIATSSMRSRGSV
jgi:transposase